MRYFIWSEFPLITPMYNTVALYEGGHLFYEGTRNDVLERLLSLMQNTPVQITEKTIAESYTVPKLLGGV